MNHDVLKKALENMKENCFLMCECEIDDVTIQDHLELLDKFEVHDLNLADNYLTDIGAISLINLKHLKKLDLDSNHLIGVTFLSELFKSKLEALYLTNNKLCLKDFQDSEYLKLIELASTNKTLKSLSLHGSLKNSKYNWDSFISDLLAHNKSIEFFALSENQTITDESLSNIYKNTSIKELNLSNCSITDKGCEYLSQSTSLETLHLENNKITDKGALLFFNHTTLKKLYISGNDLTLEAMNKFIKSNLETINIDNKNISEQETNNFYEKFKNSVECKKLQEFSKNKNFLPFFEGKRNYSALEPSTNQILKDDEVKQETKKVKPN